MADHPDDRASGTSTLDRLVTEAISEPLRPAPGLDALVGRVRARHRRRRALALGAATVPVLAVAALWAGARNDERSVDYLDTNPTVVAPGPDRSPSPTTDPTVLLDPVQVSALAVDVVAMAPSPLSAREAAAWTWTGDELFIWGGDAGGRRDDERGVLDDGAAYDPATDSWRPLPPAPLGGRARATAVWTGTEVVVWGGATTPDGPGDSGDGAAYDPATDTWRTIASAPNAMTEFPSSAWAADRVVISGGGGDGVSSSRTRWVLVYDPVADTWDRIELDLDVIQVVAAGEQVALIGHDADDLQSPVEVRWLDPLSLEITSAPSSPEPPEVPGMARYEFTPNNVGGVWTGDALVVVTSGGNWGFTATIRPGEPAWHDRRSTGTHDDPLRWPLDIWGMAQPSLLAWTGSGAVAYEGSLTHYDPAAGVVRRVEGNLMDSGVPCGYDGVSAWTGTEVLVWGGQSCRSGPDGEPTVATGARISFDP